MSNSDKMLSIDECTIPKEYQSDPLQVNTEYGCIELTKYNADEKNISEVYLVCEKDGGGKVETRVGWVLPILSIVSKDHEYFDNKYFRKHAFEVFKKYCGSEMDDRTHILIYSKRLVAASNVDIESVLINLCSYGLYPYSGYHAKRENQILDRVTNKIYLEEGFNLTKSSGFIKLLFSKIVQVEENSYARFMFFYQIIELLMEVKFHSKIKSFRSKYSNLHMIRERIQNYSTEKSLINAIYQDANLNSCDATLAQLSHNFHAYRDEKYNLELKKSDLVYEFRNAIVHSYHRFEFNDALDQFTDCIELDVYSILNATFRMPDLIEEKKDLMDRYFI